MKEEKDKDDEEQREEEKEETGWFGRFILRVKDCQEKDGFTITDLEIQVKIAY